MNWVMQNLDKGVTFAFVYPLNIAVKESLIFVYKKMCK